MSKSKFRLIIAIALILNIFALFHAYQQYATSQSPKILLVGFAPFDGRSENASWEAIENWKARSHKGGFSYRTLRLPVDYSQSIFRLEKVLRDWKPNIVLLFAEDPPRSDAVRIETVARGNNGTMLETRLPADRLREAYEKAGIKAVLSNHAGNFVSNYSFYYLMRYLKDTNRQDLIGGQIHMPIVNHSGFSKEKLGDVVEITVNTLTN